MDGLYSEHLLEQGTRELQFQLLERHLLEIGSANSVLSLESGKQTLDLQSTDPEQLLCSLERLSRLQLMRMGSISALRLEQVPAQPLDLILVVPM